MARPRQTQHEKGYEAGFNDGRLDGLEEGVDRGRQEILDWLQWAYLDDPGRPDRGTPKAEAILELARDAQKHINKLKKGQN